MAAPVQAPRKRSWARVFGRFALALLLIMISGSAHNAGLVGFIPSMFALVALGVLVWAVLGLRRTR